MELVSVKKIEKNVVELEVAVNAVEFAPFLETAYRKNAPKINLPGFRPGKAPKAMVLKQYGNFLVEEAVNSIYPSVYGDAVVKADITPVDQAKVDIKEASPDGLRFTATVTVKPEVTVKQYKGLSGTKKAAQVDPQEIAETLKKLQERGARLVTVEDRAAANGDTAHMDFEGFVDGTAFEGGKAEGFDLVLGSGQFIPGFEEQVVGHKADEAFEVHVSFPENYHVEELKGKPAVFKVKLHELKLKELPDLDDEFAKDVSEFDTLEELQADISQKLLERAQQRCDDDFENQLVSGVIEQSEMDVPEVMIEHRIDEMLQDFDYRLQSQGMNLETYMQYTGETIETFRKTFREQAERHVRIRLALEEIAKVEELKATAEEIEAEYERLAKMYGMEADKVKEYVAIVDVMNDLKVNKAIDLIKENAVVLAEETQAAAEEATEEAPAEKPKKKTVRKTAKKTEKEADAE